VAGKILDVSRGLREAIGSHFSSIADSFQSLAPGMRPEKVTVEFGLKLSGDAKFYVVNTKGEGSVTIKAEWLPK
jgi:NTP-dependent ternary system trypsin peptidase co-occuring protein